MDGGIGFGCLHIGAYESIAGVWLLALLGEAQRPALRCRDKVAVGSSAGSKKTNIEFPACSSKHMGGGVIANHIRNMQMCEVRVGITKQDMDYRGWEWLTAP
jgi:hypothetical protein